MSKYLFIKVESGIWAVSDLCRVLGVSRSDYYQWRAAEPPPTPAWQPAAQQAFTRHAKRYGTRCLQAELRAEGHLVGRYALRNWLRASKQRALSTRPLRPKYHSGQPSRHGDREPAAGPARAHPAQSGMGGDITYLPLVDRRWCYLATWRDACSRRVVGWHLAAQVALVKSLVQKLIGKLLTYRLTFGPNF